MDILDWTGVPRPDRVTLEGRYTRLEPLDPTRHGMDLLASAQQPGADDRFRYLFEEPPADFAALTPWLENAATSTDPLFFAVIERETGRAERASSTSCYRSPASARSRTAPDQLWRP